MSEVNQDVMEITGKHLLDASLNESWFEVAVRSCADNCAHSGFSLPCLNACGAAKPIVKHLTCKGQCIQ